MSLPFRQVLPETQRVLGAHVKAGVTEFTILRDVTGRVRVLVEGTADIARIQRELRDALGDWLGPSTPVWAPPAPTRSRHGVKALMQEITANKRASATPGVFLLERHVSRQAWTGDSPYSPPWPIQDALRGDKPAILTYFSHKGGVGRTTAMVSTAILMARDGHKVALVDLDIEAPGLGSFFGESTDEGLIDLLIAPSVHPLALDTAAIRVSDESIIGDGAPIRVLPAGVVDEHYMEMMARLDMGSSTNGGEMRQKLTQVLGAIAEQWPGLDYVLVDARAGFHDLGGLMLASLTHGAVVVATLNPQSHLGVRQVARLLAKPASRSSRKPVPLVVAHGMAPEPGTRNERHENNQLREIIHGILVDEYYPHDDAPALTDRGEPHDPVSLPWKGPLLGKGGALKPDIMPYLVGDDQEALYRRIAAIFPRPAP